MNKIQIHSENYKLVENVHCDIAVYLFGKPDWELNIENVTLDNNLIDKIQKKGKELSKRLSEDSTILKILLDKKWSGTGGLYEINLTKECKIEDAIKDLKGFEETFVVTELDDDGETLRSFPEGNVETSDELMKKEIDDDKKRRWK